MAIQESGEMYLENILILKNKNQYVRSIDVANYASLSKPSVSRAMGILKKEGYITIDNDGYIELTEVGLSKAKSIYERHVILTQLLVSIGVSQEVAQEDACKMEHDISEETFNKLKEHMNLFMTNQGS